MLTLTLQSSGQSSGGEDVGQFALAIGPPRVVAPLTVDVIQLDPTPCVGHGGEVDDPGGRRPLQQLHQQERQQEVT